jgi:enoyl-CoA hydratase
MAIIETSISDKILTVTVTRPEALNAINGEVMRGLDKVSQEISQNNEIRAAIITGDGEKAFVAGADIKELSALNRVQSLELAQYGQKIFKSFEDCTKRRL